MMKVDLKDVVLDNFAACLNLTVLPEQREFTPSTMFSLAEAKVNPALAPLAVYHEGIMVGFIMLGDTDKQVAYLSSMLIDAQYQRKGYGQAALIEVARWLAIKTNCYGMWGSIAKDNVAAAALCKRVGIHLTDQQYFEETVVYLDIKAYRTRFVV